MNNNLWIRKALSMCLTVAIIATYSAVTLANSEKIAGEVLVNGLVSEEVINEQNLFVQINGENAQSGRSIFSGSTVATPENASAIINLGKAGKIELAPNTIMHLSFDKKTVGGNLSAGRVTVLSSVKGMTVKTSDGKTAILNEGDSAGTPVDAETQAAAQADNANRGVSPLVMAAILAGAMGAILFAATRGRRLGVGNGSVIVSTVR